MGSFLFDDITIEEFIELRAEERAEEIAEERAQELAKAMKDKGYSLLDIMELTGLSEDKIKNL